MGNQRAKKVLSDSLGLVDSVIGPVNSVLNLPDRQMVILGEFKLQYPANRVAFLFPDLSRKDRSDSASRVKLQKNCFQSCSSFFFQAS